MPKMDSSQEKRKAQRRSGLGRRIYGDRRTRALAHAPEDRVSDWRKRLGQRRVTKRRAVPDRRGR